ncbi:MAG: alpha/beta hydrolase [Labilibaculum sp.]|nr:alpha/beta hydrolase [Labilibaculum sp.]MBI9056542.1 alpha/beta hydrolase [Labilibaculum sp.]
MKKKHSLGTIYIFITAIYMLSCSNNMEKKPKIDPIVNLNLSANIMPNITYHVVDGHEIKLDVIAPRIYLGEDPWYKYEGKKRPVLLFMHGGGWLSGDKAASTIDLMPYAARKWAIVNINYRLGDIAKAPASVIDARKALEWIYENSDNYYFDTNNIVVAGESAGAQLALMTGLLEKNDSVCGAKYVVEKDYKVNAIINWNGSANLMYPEFKNHPWLDPKDNFETAAKSLSPINYLSKNSPPIISVQGTNDPFIPIEASEKLHESCNKIGIKNKLVKIKGKGHGNFSAEERTYIYNEIWKFLEETGIKTSGE